MSRKPENTFRDSVHKHLPRDLYHVKMNNPFAGGLFDDYYSGHRADLWIEYKFIKLPALPETMILPELSALQQDWGRKRHAEGRKVFVIVGCKEGGVVYAPLKWEKPMKTKDFVSMLQTRTALASWILAQARGGP